MLFNPAESIDLNGNTGPFIQYTHARIKSVLRKGRATIAGKLPLTERNLSGQETTLIKLIYSYPQILQSAANSLSPAVIASYAYDLAKAFNHFYHDHVIVDEHEPETSAFRLKLSEITADLLFETTALLGIKAPERM
jgi:arginyl-tRNA synthetase